MEPKATITKSDPNGTSKAPSRGAKWHIYGAAIGLVTLYLFVARNYELQFSVRRKGDFIQAGIHNTRCKPPLPPPLTLLSVPPSGPIFDEPSRRLHDVVRERVSRGDMDSLVLGIIGPDGIIWSNGYGVAKANDTRATNPPNEHSIYRIASISKLFTTLETFILRDRGILNWDDGVDRFFPEFTYWPYGWHEYLQDARQTSKPKHLAPITLRQLASHMSGIGRDYPPVDFKDWPSGLPPAWPPNGDFSTKKKILKAIAENPLVAPQYSYPIYSNTGYALLGWCNTVADEKATRKPITHAEIIQRDILTPLGMNGSSFILSDHNVEQMVFPKLPLEAELDMTDVHNPAGGQMSSLSDLAKTMQMFLNHEHSHSLLSAYSLREWIRPLHSYYDSLTQVGLAWEIQQFPDSHGRPQSYYSKGGNTQFYHSEFSFNRDLGYGVVVLMTGEYSDSSWFVKRAIEIFQPVFEGLLETTTKERYAGVWRGETDDGKSEIKVDVKDGLLWVTRGIINDEDILAKYMGGLGLALWSTGRLDEFRAAVGRGELNTDPSLGCFPYWVSFDNFDSRGAPVDLVYFEMQEGERVLRFPSAGVTLHRD